MRINFTNQIQKLKYFSIILILLSLFSCTNKVSESNQNDIILENADMQLILSSDGSAKSLIHKSSGEECLMRGVKIPAFTLTQNRPYDNEVQLAYPAKQKTFAADTVYRDGDNLIVGFELTDYDAIIGLKITDEYIGFTLKGLEYHKAEFGVKRRTEVDGFTLLQLPVKNRGHFGELLNVVWDKDIAVNLLATNSYAQIDADKRNGYKILTAGGDAKVKIEGVGAALITTDKSKLLDRIDKVEKDFNLPLGVESRRSEEYKNSYYELRNVTPENIDEHIKYAKQGGFRQMVIYYPDFATSMGHFNWRPEYPNGMEDLKLIAKKIEDAGMIFGFHIHYSKAQINDQYVTPVPDNRLNLRTIFTLHENLKKGQTTITIEENPAGTTLEDGRRILKLGKELISFESYTTTPPYQFLNCKRGTLNTKEVSRESGDLIGLLDVDTWPIFVRFNQKTDIQQEVAERLANIIEETGIEFIYYDGAEDVPEPYWYYVSKAQLDVYNALETKSVFAEGALKSHFSWHILTRGNAFDTFAPEFIKEATRKHPQAEMELVSDDFTSVDFGWIGYTPPSDKPIGIEPEMLEFVTSRAAGWNSIISLLGNLDNFKNHARTNDNLEVVRRWEEVRVNGFLTDEMREKLKSHFDEHTLLINEKGEYELVKYQQIEDVADGNKSVRAFIFERNNKTWVVYWHTSGSAEIELNVNAKDITLYKDLGKEISVKESGNKVILPVNSRLYIEFNLSSQEVKTLFKNAKL
ncbi:MAG: hypothetical protein L3J54_07610 [Draconibacterium sp.]|nr:hypothetical protein [Draconibacterium sp.]